MERVFGIEQIGGMMCFPAEGEAAAQAVCYALHSGENVTLNFARVEQISLAFLTALYDGIYKEFSAEQLRGHLSLKYISAELAEVMATVARTAHDYYHNPFIRQAMLAPKTSRLGLN
jgi:hypothetical protein